MSLAALPYAVFLLLAEFAIGGQLVLYAADLRGAVTEGFIKTSAALVTAGTALALWTALTVASVSSIDGFALSERYVAPSRVALGVLLSLQLGYTLLLARRQRREARLLGVLACLTALGSLGLISAIVQGPTWSYVGAYLSLLAGGLALGGVTLAMSLGHWYLVTPRLPEQPLNELTLAVLAIIAMQLLLLIVNVLAAPRAAPHALSVSLGRNPAFWLRVAVGLLFPLALCAMAWLASRVRGMMSATGLLYLATGAVLAGEALACALLFSTAIPG